MVLLLSTAMLMSACDDEIKSSDDELSFDYTTNYQYYYSNLNGFSLPITKSETGYYAFLPNRLLYYIDKEHQEATPLCNKPNCTHNDDEMCNAYFSLFAEPSSNTCNIVQYYEGDLYIVVKDEDDMGSFLGNTLYKVTADGSTREKLLSFRDGISHWLIHKGYFYFSQDKFADNIDSYSVYDSFSIKRCQMDNIHKEPEEIFNSGNYCDNLRGTYQFTAYDDYIYVPVCPISEDEIKMQEESGKVTVSADQEYYSININTSKINRIINDEGDISSPFFYNKKLVYHIDNTDINSKFKYYTCNLDGSNYELLTETDNGDNLFANESQLYSQNYAESSDKSASNDSMGDNIKLLDSSFHEKSSFVVPVKYSVVNIPQDSDCFIFVKLVDNMNCEIYYVDKLKTESLSGQTVEYKTLLSSLRGGNKNINALSQVDENVRIDTTDNELKNIFENTQNKLYKISASYDKTLSDEVDGGFSVTLSWPGTGGNSTANFQILKFKTAANAENFVKENPFSFVNGEYVAFVSVDKIPVEIKDMLVSIISDDPVSPINTTDFGGEIYSFD